MILTKAFFVNNNSSICINIDDSLKELDKKHVLHINIQGLAGKTLILETFFQSADNKFLAVCLCEHWLSDAEIDGLVIGRYRVVSSFCRVTRMRGGVAVLLRDDYCCTPFSLNNFCVELVGELAGIRVPAVDLIILSIYRSPSENFNDFLRILDNVLDHLNVSCKNVIVTGDFNVFFNERDTRTARLADLMTEYGLTTDFSEPTRMNRCLDNIFTNLNSLLRINTVNLLCSDHLGVVAEFSIVQKGGKSSFNLVRPVTQTGLNDFFHYVDSLDLNFIGDSALTLCDRTGKFLHLLSVGADICFPERRMHCDQRGNLRIPWFTQHLRQMRSTLEFLSDAYNNTADPRTGVLRNEYRRMYRESLNEAKLSANNRFVKENVNSAASMWKLVNSKRSSIKKVNAFDKISADRFNDFFLNTPTALVSKINSGTDPIGLLVSSLSGAGGALGKEQSASFFEFSRVSEVEVRTVLDQLKNKKSKDYYGLNSIMIKKVKNVIIPPLTKLINESITSGSFPDSLKIACVIPIFKKGDICDLNSYRPISILPILSKIYESILKNQLVKYFETENLFSCSQYGFRAGRSTVGAAASLIEGIVEGFEDGGYSCASFLDLTKAFDCVNHTILLRKLYMYNVGPLACKLLSSYLSNRRQSVTVGGQQSRLGVVNLGVPQGSILGPIMFLIFINDLPGLSCDCDTSLILYADDTTVISRKNNLHEAQAALDDTVNETKKWFSANGLLLNPSKTTNITFTLGRQAVERSCGRFLGFQLDTGLVWTSHSDIVTKRLSSVVFLLRRLSPTVSPSVLRLAYFGLFQGIMSYGILLWGHSSMMQRVFNVQRRVVRVMCGLGYREECRGHFVEMGVMTAPSLYIFECLKYIRSEAADRVTYADIHSYNTRHRENIAVNFKRLERSRNSINYYAARFYNVINRGVRALPTRSFLSIMKEHLTKKSYYSIDEYLSDKSQIRDCSLLS